MQRTSRIVALSDWHEVPPDPSWCAMNGDSELNLSPCERAIFPQVSTSLSLFLPRTKSVTRRDPPGPPGPSTPCFVPIQSPMPHVRSGRQSVA